MRFTALLATTCVLLTNLATSSARAELIFGVQDVSFTLVSFDSATPGTQTTIGALSGVTPGETIRSIDARPADGQLYALSTNAAGSSGSLYTVNTTNGSLTLVGSIALASNSSAQVKMDFNPQADRLRVVTGDNKSYRFMPNGTLVQQDGDTAFASGDPNFGTTPFISNLAYSNNVVGATSTTLFAWEFTTDNLATIGSVNGIPTSPNSGQMFTVGGPPSFVSNTASSGLDISGPSGVAYLQIDDFAQPLNPFDRLFTVDLSTGGLSFVGNFNSDMLDIAVAPVAVPEPTSLAFLGLPAAAWGVRRFRRRAS